LEKRYAMLEKGKMGDESFYVGKMGGIDIA
jgi:hypothetical protein